LTGYEEGTQVPQLQLGTRQTKQAREANKNIQICFDVRLFHFISRHVILFYLYAVQYSSAFNRLCAYHLSSAGTYCLHAAVLRCSSLHLQKYLSILIYRYPHLYPFSTRPAHSDIVRVVGTYIKALFRFQPCCAESEQTDDSAKKAAQA
jgi:hypothetical protein